MTTTFHHVVGGQIDSKFTVNGNTVVIGKLPKEYEFLIHPEGLRSLEDGLQRYSRGVGNAMSIRDENCGLFVQTQTEYPDEVGVGVGLPIPDRGTREAGYTTVKTYVPPIGNSNH